jgi:large subunit ribosomal protein L5e
MGLFVKVQKDSAYFKRFVVKYRRRREAKTDYKARRKMIQQAKNKYNTAKYRFVVRITNRDVITQIIHAKTSGDFVVAAAYSHELKTKYGVPVGLTNYAACYATGLLCARRVLAATGLDSKYEGVANVDGKYFQVEESGDRRPFAAVLDTGLARTTSGARVFAALKGAVDGGLAIPHSPARFSGYTDGKLDEKAHRNRLLGVHVAEYMKDSIANGTNGNNFSAYIKNKVNAGSIEKMWLEAHKKIRSDNHKPEKKEKKSYKGKR